MSIGDAMAEAMVGLVIMAFVAGMAAIGVLWALWHFVFSHLTLGWQ